MKTFKEFLNENKEQQIKKAAKEVHDFLFSGGGKAIDMENFIDVVLKDHKLSRSDRKAVVARVKGVHGYTGKHLDKFLSESHVNEYLNEQSKKVDIIKMLDREYGKGKLKHKDFVNNITFLGTEDGVDWYAMGIDDAENAETDVYMAKVYDNGNKIKLNANPYTTIQGSDPDSQIKDSIKRLKLEF